jgi:hypothetical protein
VFSLKPFSFGDSTIKIQHMNAAVLTKRFNLLPEEMQQQVFDFVEFLLLKQKGVNAPVDSFTQEEKEELLNIWKEYEQNPDNAISLEDAMEQTRVRYGA